MIIRSIDSNGDWVFGAGISDYKVAEPAIDQNIATRLFSFVNDCFFNLPFGIDWWNLLAGKSTAAVVLACRTVIVQSAGVVRVNSVDATLDSTTRRLSISYNVDTIYTKSLQNAVQIPIVAP